MEAWFQYGEREVECLKGRDVRLREVMERVGIVRRRVILDLFAALVHSIVGQQISTKAHETIWERMVMTCGEVTPGRVVEMTDEELQGVGISYRKVTYIRRAAERVLSGEFDMEALQGMEDEEAVGRLMTLDGIGRWSAEMLLLFSMQRPDILSYGDLGIRRGLRMVYHHREITPALFEKYRRRYSPYGSVASLYLWAVAGGAVEGMKDYGTKRRK